MAYFLTGLGVLAIVLLLLWLFANANPASLTKLVRWTIALVLFAAAAVFGIGGRWGYAIVLGGLGLTALTAGRLGPLDLGGSKRSQGSASTVRSAFLEMQLDHDTGAMQGRVLAGRYTGKTLDELTEPSLRELLEETAADADSTALLEGYLDRRFPGWREHVEGDEAARPRSAPDASAMTDKEAYEILGLAPGASEAEIRAAHRRLMAKFHPDVQGTSYLAAKINQAKDWLLGRDRRGHTRH